MSHDILTGQLNHLFLFLRSSWAWGAEHDLPRITEVNITNVLDRLTTMSNQDFVNLAAESRITHEQLAHVFSTSMLHDQETAGGGFDRGYENGFQDADFASWVGIIKASAPQPVRRPAATILRR